MDNHKLLVKVSRLFPSSFTSCQFRALPDVAETSINTITKPNSNIARGPKCPPAPPMDKPSSTLLSLNHLSSSSNSGWFTSSDDVKTRHNDVETDTFLSISSNSGDSFRLKTSRRFRRCEEMKSIDETGRCSFSSLASYDTVLSRKTATSGAANKPGCKTWPEHQLGSDIVSTQQYYRSHRKIGKNRRKTKRSSSSRKSMDQRSVMIGESYAVEKRSSDPHSDFRSSMVEMIVEKQIFAAEDLETLLLSFLSLNAPSYHGIIFHVFSEICQTLFTN